MRTYECHDCKNDVFPITYYTKHHFVGSFECYFYYQFCSNCQSYWENRNDHEPISKSEYLEGKKLEKVADMMLV